MKLDINPPWSEPPRYSVTLYSYDLEEQGSSEFAILDASALYDSGDVESQDSGFEYASTTGIDIKEHRIEQTEELLSTHGLPFIQSPRAEATPAKFSARDPRLRHVSLASLLSLYERTATPIADPQNIAQGSADVFQFRDLSMEGEDSLIIGFDDK